MPYYNKGFFPTIFPTSHIPKIINTAKTWKQKNPKSILCNVRKYMNIMLKSLSTLTGSYLLPKVALPRSARSTQEIHVYKSAWSSANPTNPAHLQWVRPACCLSSVQHTLFQMVLSSPQSQGKPLSRHSVLLLLQYHCILDRVYPHLPPKHLLPMGANLFWASFSSSAFLVWAQFFHTSSPSSGFREFGSRSSGEGCGCDCGSTSATWTVWAYERETMKMCQYCFVPGPFGKTPRLLVVLLIKKKSLFSLLFYFQEPLEFYSLLQEWQRLVQCFSALDVLLGISDLKTPIHLSSTPESLFKEVSIFLKSSHGGAGPVV